jgi:hypothetical protein
MKNLINKKETKVICTICSKEIFNNYGEHIKNEHGEDKFKKAVLKAKASGMPDSKIGTVFNITFRQLERIITEAYGVNISMLTKQ